MEFHNRNGISGRIKVLAVFFSPFLFIGKKPFEDTDLPNVVFYSLRHSSTTYKLKLNKGDLKAIQGDIGHAQIDMITEIYAHILDEDRKINAQKFETAFYSNPDMRPVERSLQGEESGSVPNPDVMMKQLESSPQAMDAFTQKFIEQYGDQIMTQLAKKMLGA